MLSPNEPAPPSPRPASHEPISRETASQLPTSPRRSAHCASRAGGGVAVKAFLDGARMVFAMAYVILDLLIMRVGYLAALLIVVLVVALLWHG